MRVTYVGPVPPLRSGIAQHGGHLAAALADQADVTVLSWQHQYPKLLFRRPQVDPDATPHPGAEFTLRWWDPVSWWRAGRRAAGSDLVVIVWTTPFHALPYKLVSVLARRNGGRARVVAIVHNAVPHEALPLVRPLSRWVLGQVDGIVVHASAIADELVELTGPVETVVTPMPALVDVDPRPLPAGDEVRLLFFGFIRHYKGLDVALDALALLRDRGDARGSRYRLTVVGELWDPSDRWEARVAERGLTDVVELRHDYVPDAAVADLLAAHHAVVLPYRTASQSGIAPIALASGRPVIATRVGGLVEVVTDEANGTLAAPDDAASLADAIERCADNLPALAERAGQGAPAWADTAAAVRKAAGLAPS